MRGERANRNFAESRDKRWRSLLKFPDENFEPPSLSLSLSKEVERVKNAKLKYQSISSLPRLLAQY